MSLVDSIAGAQARGAAVRPAVGGFPYLAQSLRQAGVTHIAVTVPSWTTVLSTAAGSVVQQGTPMFDGAREVPAFDRDRFVAALRADQEGHISFPEWMNQTWDAGIVWYEVDLEARQCTYRAPGGESYVEEYPGVDLAHVAGQ